MLQETTPPPKRNIVSWIFISSDEPRLRAGWRLLLQTLLLIVISIPLTLAASALGLSRITGNPGFLIDQILELSSSFHPFTSPAAGWIKSPLKASG